MNRRGTNFLHGLIVIRGDGCKLKERKFRLNVGKKIFTQKVVWHWHRLPTKLWVPYLWRIRDQFGWSSEHPELVADNSACGRGLEMDGH